MAEEKEKLLTRGLKTKDLFSFTRIIKKMNIKPELKKLVKDVTGKTEEEKKAMQRDLKVDIMFTFIESIGNADQEIYKFLGDLADKKPKEIEDQPPQDTMQMVEELFNEDGFGDFLSSAVK
ncbi:MAG: hypothetical protein LKE46_00220 [Clostridium sp.]|jgi:hypothetical protein|uniref:hypothetical protein n=1 Tax=Clostridium sp. TaxID=1506 RepID=UPI0025C47506|nr:hypothetical protein [Clostridium sp.]MCH3962692.1 hypothetical protein [Clostridium sp.]MCI2201077.1 hypothetical protein [Clostridium sp.]